MSQKTKTAKFQYRDRQAPAYRYRCVQVTDSVDFNPGDSYSEADVKELCENKAWKVTIVNERTS